MVDLEKTLAARGFPAGDAVIREAIRKAGFRWKSAKVVLTSTDPEYRQKLERLQTVLSNLDDDERFFSVDEYGPFAVKAKPGRVLVGPGENPSVPQWQNSKGWLIATAALELSRNQLTHFYSKAKNTAEMIRMAEKLLDEYRNARTLYLSWDAASWHMSKELLAFVDKHNAKADGYGEPQRVYHTLGHLAHMFAALDSVPLWNPAIEWATWYHDACYRPGDRANEERSAQMAMHALASLGVDSALGLRVTQLIEATRTHEGTPGDAVQQLFLDADLSILGAPTANYAAYAHAIREEHRHIPDVLYCRGRKAFLQHMLSRNSIFLSEEFKRRYEIQAQSNLAKELEGLF